MSVFQFEVAAATPINKVVASSTPVAVAGSADAIEIVPWFQVNEVSNGTPNVSVDLYDGATAHILGDDGGKAWIANGMTGKTSIRFSQGFVVPKGWSLRVTTSTGSVHVIGVKQRIQ